MVKVKKMNDLKTKQNNRAKFRERAFWLVVATMVVGAGLAFSGVTTASTFGTVAVGVMTFAGAVFAADYATKVETD